MNQIFSAGWNTWTTLWKKKTKRLARRSELSFVREANIFARANRQLVAGTRKSWNALPLIWHAPKRSNEEKRPGGATIGTNKQRNRQENLVAHNARYSNSFLGVLQQR
jgi:hypothetical protein